MCRIIIVGSIFMLLTVSINICYTFYKCAHEMFEYKGTTSHLEMRNQNKLNKEMIREKNCYLNKTFILIIKFFLY